MMACLPIQRNLTVDMVDSLSHMNSVPGFAV